MTDREKVIKAFENCIGVPKCCDCPWEDCEGFVRHIDLPESLAKAAYELLQEQDAEWVYGEDKTGVDGWHCSKCNFFEPWFYDFDDDIDFIKRYKHCPKCGRRMTSYTGKQEGR